MPESLFSLQACNVIKKEAVAQVFSSQFCEIFKNTFFTSLLLIKTPRFLHILDIQEISSPPYYQDPPIYLALKSMEQWKFDQNLLKIYIIREIKTGHDAVEINKLSHESRKSLNSLKK